MRLVEAIATAAAALVGVFTLLGLGVRWVLFPWLRDHLATPLLERLDLLAGRLEGLAGDLSVASRMYEGHIKHSDKEATAIWNAIHQLRESIPRHRLRRLRNTTTQYREDTDDL